MLTTRPGRVGTAYGLAGYQAARGGYHRRWPAGSVALSLAGSELVGARPVDGVLSSHSVENWAGRGALLQVFAHPPVQFRTSLRGEFH